MKRHHALNAVRGNGIQMDISATLSPENIMCSLNWDTCMPRSTCDSITVCVVVAFHAQDIPA